MDCLNLRINRKNYDVKNAAFITLAHYSDVTMGVLASLMFAQPFVQAQIKEKIKAPRPWPLWWESTGPVESPYKGPVTRKMFPIDDVTWGTIVCKILTVVIWL